ncbi:uncharacterized protein GGS25DRAFT_503487 [Hypoxylon fragiforme]|uniref:uncharacterized protein n=1 Tax=Hypoxylon fragiforme TaxID=63214 RepID=UPI0020C62E3B|nr:uncharacterized protein GGS25DRAFT_503487 [Hypoxylon fragiforme]KAI2605090.1 hypothetical protein GGS25DRAFT_503487 [Hypoxylon fragiforme]
MSDTPDLSLPVKSPEYDNNTALTPAPIYTLVDLTDTELADLQRVCEAECIDTGNEPGANVRIAPQPRFIGQPLRAVFDHHLELVKEKKFEPRWFIAVADKEWRSKGVILVTLDDDELERNVDSFRIRAANTGLTVANLQVANSDWAEEKENYEFDLDGDDDDDED